MGDIPFTLSGLTKQVAFFLGISTDLRLNTTRALKQHIRSILEEPNDLIKIDEELYVKSGSDVNSKLIVDVANYRGIKDIAGPE